MYIGATGLNEIDDLIASSIEDASNILVNRIVYDINNTSNYVWNTSNILIGRINDTSNYVRTTNNILSGRIDDIDLSMSEVINISTISTKITDTSN